MDKFVTRKRKPKFDEEDADPKKACLKLSVRKENLSVDYSILYNKSTSDELFQSLERELEYFSGEKAKVKLFGKWMDIPRKQVAFGDQGLKYSFSGNSLPAKPWEESALVAKIKDDVEKYLDNKYMFNFVLVNRYKDGEDHMGEHRDDEAELVQTAPIVSLSLGQERDFVFRHKDNRKTNSLRPDLEPLKLSLQNGSLLVMNEPTNRFWYHSLPKRKRIFSPRINFTFRIMRTHKANRN